MGWIDTHAHLAEPTLFSQLDDVLQRAERAGVSGILCVAVDAETSQQVIQIASKHTMLRASVGIHPNYAHQASDEDWQRVVTLCGNDHVVALGETGLDRYWDDCPFDVQLNNFQRHWELSRRTGLPLIIHMRECEAEMLQALQEQSQRGELRGVMHSFAGSIETAMKCLEMGLYISFAGMLTYKKSVELREVAAKIPLDRVLVETDCPYLSPEPYRSKRPNEPAWVVQTATVLAKCYGMGTSELMNRTRENTLRLFSRWDRLDVTQS